MKHSQRFFVSGTGTGVGKTHLAAALARLLSRTGPCLAIKPFETGVEHIAQDAARLAEASALSSEVFGANLPPFFRHPKPVAPFDAVFGEPSALEELLRAKHDTAEVSRSWGHHLIVEGAGGIAVPLHAHGDHVVTIADFVAELQLPLIMVAPNQLGVLSHTMTAVHYAKARGLSVAMVLLNDGAAYASDTLDISQQTNARTLKAALGCAVHRVPKLAKDLDAAAGALATLGLFD